VKITDVLSSTTYVEGGTGAVLVMGGHGAARVGGCYPDFSPRNHVWFDGWLNLLSEFENTPTYQNLLLSAFNKQITQVPTKTSVINFIIELLELKPIFKKLASIPKHIREGTLTKAVSGKSLSRRSPINAAKGGAKGFLAVEFQWLPFISDIYAFITAMDTVTKRINFLIKTKKEETTVRFVKEDCAVRAETGTEIIVYDDSSDVRQSIWLTDYQCDFISTWKLYQDLEGLDDVWAGLRGLFVDLGVNNPAKIVWNAIPFSFLVDWVAPVSQWLEKAAAQPFYGVWKTYDVTSSVNEKYTFENRFVAKHGGTNGPEFKAVVQQYRRLNYLPLSLGAIDFSQLTDTQQKLALALAVSGVR